jgi:hypothetical protein
MVGAIKGYFFLDDNKRLFESKTQPETAKKEARKENTFAPKRGTKRINSKETY